MALPAAPLSLQLQLQFHRNHSLSCRNTSSVQQLKSRMSRNRIPRNRILMVSSCQNNEPSDKSTPANKQQKEKTRLFAQVFNGVEKLGIGLKENMSPKQKGDWKDLMLMSLSFAVYVYMSQQIVCAYFVWMSMPRQSW